MEDTEFRALFKHYAFSGDKKRDLQSHSRLEELAEQIVRLGSSPLAAKVVGSQLKGKTNIDDWKDALNIKIDNLSEPKRALLWSYQKLDPHLQRCFLYCSLFPKGYKYNINKLVHLWVAEGFVDARNMNKRMEDIGMDYFKEMVSGSFFQPFSEYCDGFYIMHDLLHDLAESLSREDCFRLEDNKVNEIPCTVRYLSVRVESMVQHKLTVCKLQHLRTLICIDPLVDVGSDLFKHVLLNLKKLRILYLSFYNTRQLPESIGELKHLRYLNITSTLISELPKSLCGLYHLELLHLNDVSSFPDRLCHLSKLRHLETRGNLGQIRDIGRLTLLQHIGNFHIQKQKGYELRQLRSMNEIGGSLSLINLENVTGKDEALESKLYQKSRLKEFYLLWNDGNNMNPENSLHLGILEGLVPPPQLEHLSIEGYKSTTYPSWLQEGSYLENVDSFFLCECSFLETLPSNTKLFRRCHKLRLSDLPNMKKLPSLPEGLTKFSIHNCPLLLFVTSDEPYHHDHSENTMRIEHMAAQFALIELMGSGSFITSALLLDLSSMKQLAALMDSDISKNFQTIECALEREDEVVMTEDVIKAWMCCHEQRMRLIFARKIGLPLIPPAGLTELILKSCTITDGALSVWLAGLSSLRVLYLCEIMTLTMLPSEEVLKNLTKLEHLKIHACLFLRSLGGLRAASSLSYLILSPCPSLELARGAEFMPASLGRLSINYCVLAPDLFCGNWPHLKAISLSNCRCSGSLFVGGLSSLKTFALRHLPDLCVIEGLSSLEVHNMCLIDIAKLSAECVAQFRVQDSLCVSSCAVLNNMILAEGFTVPTSLSLESCKEPYISFKETGNYSSVKHLELNGCEMSSMPQNLKCLSRL
uniref:NB-ARC domain-containing protein n=1 Tax=Oryza brachyantha TaxID=4533 RepID=J3M6D9_ORYBR